ncbi:hypothetical protein GGI12_003638 [Dipsacomyces acuminosporus]|nr:hypothetical protein GGI12_003638 [Dipsacomyces acuminosporus]
MSMSSYVYLPGQQTCVAVSEDGRSVAVGSDQGTVSVLSIDFGIASASGVIFGAAADGSQASAAAIGASAPLMFASGLADPMNTDIGYTSMAGYTSGGNSSARSAGAKGGKWMLSHVLHGHDAAILDVAINADHDTVASASADGTVVLWARRSGQYLRTLEPAGADSSHLDDVVPAIPSHSHGYSRIERVLLSSEALLICYSVSGSLSPGDYCDRLDPVRSLNQSTNVIPQAHQGSSHGDGSSGPGSQGMVYESSQNSSRAEHGNGCTSEIAALHVYNINGQHLCTRRLVHHLRDIALTKDGRFGACVSYDSRVAVFDTHTLGIVRQFELPACGCSVAWSGVTEQQLLVGCEGGQIVVISTDLSCLH